jgi:hypothetical protein
MAVLVTEKTMRHACESESAKTIIERGHERGTWAGMCSNGSSSLRLTLLSCCQKKVTTAAVDVEEKATMAEMLMAPAASREGGQRPSVVDVG